MKKPVLLLFLCLIFAGMNTLKGQTFANPLFIPDTLHGPTYNLTMDDSSHQFMPGNATTTYGINGSYLGPTLMMRKGDFVQMNVTNMIADSTTMHWHGFHVAPEDDGGPHSIIEPGMTWSPDFLVYEEATTMWYHPHLHHHTAEQVYWGAAGMIIIHDDHEDSLGLPNRYGVDDFPMILQDKTFTTDNQFVYAAMNDTMMVNGTLGPYLEVPAQMVRFRFLNGANQRVFNLGWAPTLTAWQIGSDGGLLENRLPTNRIQLAPGERAEVVFDFSGLMGTNHVMFAFNSEMEDGVSGGPGGPGGGPGNPLDAVDFPVIQFRVVAPTPNPVTSIPTALNTYNIPNLADVDRTRVKVMDSVQAGGPYYINGTPFNMMVVNDTVLLDDIEVWEIYNTSEVSHPFHIHDVQFHIFEYNGGPPPPHLAGRKDVLLSNPGDTIKFITVFEDFADSIIPYMYHCHNLFHEDAGMMGQFLVLESTWVGLEPSLANDLSGDFRVYPNPTAGALFIKALGGARAERFRVVNLQGKVLLEREMGWQAAEERVDLQGLGAGVYLLEVESADGRVGVWRILRY